MAYAATADIRAFTSLTTSDVSDADVTTLIGHATAQINRDVASKVIEEVVEFIDNERENKVNGSNTTYYTRSSYEWYLFDLDDDGDFDTSDVLAYEITSAGVKSALTVSSVDALLGKFVVSSAPASSSQVRVTYRYSPVPVTDLLLKKAAIELTAALAFSKVEAADFGRIQLGKLAYSSFNLPKGFKQYWDQYQQTMSALRTRIMRKTEATKKFEILPNQALL